jgi:hypothetical protein
MKKLVLMVRTGPVVVGEFRGGKGETAKRFDKTDKNAPPLEFGMYKMNLEMLADGSPVMVTVFLDDGGKVAGATGKAGAKCSEVFRSSGSCGAGIESRMAFERHESNREALASEESA